MEGDEIIWAETTDGGLIKQLFGYFPTLHDARVRSIDIDRERNSVELVVDYRDLVEGSDSHKELEVRLLLVWSGVEKLEMTFAENYLLGFSTRRQGHLIRADFEIGYGFHGFIESETFEAKLHKVDPGHGDEEVGAVAIRYR